jgi:hypothetical protein
VQSAYRLSRAGNGNTRLDSGKTSVISNPSAGHAILLNHVEKTAMMIQPAPSDMPALPGIPPIPPPGDPGLAPTTQVQDLGKGMIQGHEVQGKRYLIQPPAMPNIPATPQPPAVQAPGMPPAPGIPKAPGAPGIPSAPNAPQAPTTADVWTSTKMHLPMLTKMNGGFGQLTQACQAVSPGEPHPAAFQIPPDYKMIPLPALKPPAIPAV